jgi:hypothetical protein
MNSMNCVAHDGVPDRTGLEDVFLEHLGPVVVQLGHLVHADDREDDDMSDAALLGCGEEVIHRRLEDGGRGVVEGRGVRQVDDDVGARHGFFDNPAAHEVHARGQGVRDGLVAGRVEDLHDP